MYRRHEVVFIVPNHELVAYGHAVCVEPLRQKQRIRVELVWCEKLRPNRKNHSLVQRRRVPIHGATKTAAAQTNRRTVTAA